MRKLMILSVVGVMGLTYSMSQSENKIISDALAVNVLDQVIDRLIDSEDANENSSGHYNEHHKKKTLGNMEFSRSGNNPTGGVRCKKNHKTNWDLSAGETRLGNCIEDQGIVFNSPVPGLEGNIKLWLDADDSSTLTMNGTQVSEWNDKSGNGYKAFQTSSVLKPQTATINSKTAISFNASNNTRLISDFDFSVVDGAEVFTVVNVPFTNHSSAIVDFNGGTYGGSHVWVIATFAESSKVTASSGMPKALYSDYTTNEPKILSTNYEVGTGLSELFIDGNLVESGTKTASAYPGGWVFGANGNEDNFYYNGTLGEVLVFDKKLDATERQAVIDYLNAKWSL